MNRDGAYVGGVEQTRDPTCLGDGAGEDGGRSVGCLRLVAEVDQAGVSELLGEEEVVVVYWHHDGDDGLGRLWASILVWGRAGIHDVCWTGK